MSNGQGLQQETVGLSIIDHHHDSPCMVLRCPTYSNNYDTMLTVSAHAHTCIHSDGHVRGMHKRNEQVANR